VEPTDWTHAAVVDVLRGHAFIQKLRQGHYELGVDTLPGLNLAAAFDELAQVI